MPFVAGNEIDAHCPSCKRDQKHTVIEVHSGVVQEVRCFECKSVHPYKRPQSAALRRPKPEAAPKKRRATTKKKKSVEEGPPQVWQDSVLTTDPETIKAYSIKETFAVEDVVDHKTFGLGVVTAVLEDGKIEVAFREGVKKLVHARP